MSAPMLAGGTLTTADYAALKRTQRLIREIFDAELHDTLDSKRVAGFCDAAQRELAAIEQRHNGRNV